MSCPRLSENTIRNFECDLDMRPNTGMNGQFEMKTYMASMLQQNLAAPAAKDDPATAVVVISSSFVFYTWCACICFHRRSAQFDMTHKSFKFHAGRAGATQLLFHQMLNTRETP